MFNSFFHHIYFDCKEWGGFLDPAVAMFSWLLNIYHQTSLVSKTGEPAPLSNILNLNIGENKDSQEELLRRKQVSEFVSKLSPEQLALNQKRVQEYSIDQK